MGSGKLISALCLLGGIFFPPKSFAHPDPSHSLAEINQHLESSPDSQETLRAKVDVLLTMDRPTQAREVVVHLLTLSPKAPENLVLAARVTRFEGDLPSAVAQVESLTQADPGFSAGWDYLAKLLYESGRRDEAIQAQLRFLKDFQSLNPSDYMVCASWLRARSQSGDDQTALGVLDQGITRIGVLIGLEQAAIEIDLTLKNWSSALRRIDALAARFRPSVDFATQRGDILEQAGRYGEAASAFDSAIAILQASPYENRDSKIFQPRLAQLTQRKQANLARAAKPAGVAQP